jgi:hypothetical protein
MCMSWRRVKKDFRSRHSKPWRAGCQLLPQMHPVYPKLSSVQHARWAFSCRVTTPPRLRALLAASSWFPNYASGGEKMHVITSAMNSRSNLWANALERPWKARVAQAQGLLNRVSGSQVAGSF